MTFALLQQAQPQGPPAWTNFILLGGMALLFYFLMIRPQSKARKEMEARLSKLKAGDEVILGSGLYATIERVDEKDPKILYLKLGSGVVKAKRQAVVALAAEPQQD
ncbi:MAG TPA: preprotein translocase subunit YajC [Holophagaceae bacterium]|nr:preprotein translocase subunit YajC [Holophagaceae bacterium]